MSKDHNTITCTHGKGLACPVCYDQTHSLENSEFVVDPFDTYEQHELPPDATKSSCIALRASELNIEVINHPMAPTPEQGDMSGLPTPVGTVTFGELEDGAEFYVAMTWAYGSRNKLQKVMEDGEHNAVWCSATHIGELIPDGIRVVRA